MRKDWASYIRARAPRYGIDPHAALAVASVEGLSGRVGDNGTSFGPFQLHVGGALPRGKGRAWAESKAGIDYALQRIAGVSKGLKGEAAINAIVRRFERPADPDGEVQRALGNYGKVAASSNSTFSSAPSVGSEMHESRDAARRAMLGVLQQRNAAFVAGRPEMAPGPMALVQAAMMARSASNSDVDPGVQVSTQTSPGKSHGAIDELFYDPKGGIKMGQPIKAIGGHGNHVHFADDNPQIVLAVAARAKKLGLKVGENPAFGGVNPVHTKNSYHYRTFKGRKLGQALDISGDPRRMAALYDWVANRF